MHKNMPATTWLAWVHVFNYFTCLLDRGASSNVAFFSGVNLKDIISNQKLLSNDQIDKRQNTSVFVLCYIYVQLILEVLL